MTLESILSGNFMRLNWDAFLPKMELLKDLCNQRSLNYVKEKKKPLNWVSDERTQFLQYAG